MAVTIGDVTIRIGASTKTLNSDLRKAERSLQASAAKFRSIGQSLTLGVTAPLALIGGASFKMASDFEESLNKVRVAFGDSAADVEAFAKTTLSSIGLAEGSALEMASLFGDMATSMGLTQPAAAQMSKSLVSLAGDLASFKNINISEAQTALAGVFTGETESLKRLGVVMTETNLEAFALEQGIMKKVKAMTQAEKVSLRYAYIMNNTKNAQGDFARTADGAANQMRTFQESVKQLGASFGSILLPIITPIIVKVNEIVAKFQALDGGTKKLIITIAAIAAVIGPAILIFGKLSFAVGVLQLAWVKLNLAFAAGGIKAAFAFLGGPAILAVGAVAAAVYLIYKNWETVKKSMVDVANYFVDLYNESIIFRGAVNSVVAIFKNIAAGAKLAFNVMLSGVELVGKTFVDTFKGIGSLIEAVLTGEFGSIPDIIKKSFGSGLSNVKGFVKDTANEFEVFNVTVLKNTQEALDKTFNPQPLQKFRLATEETKKKVEDLNNTITDTGKSTAALGRGEIQIPTLATGAANPFEPLRKNIDGTLADIRKNTQKELGQALQGKVKFQTSAYQEWFNDFGGELESIQLQQQGGLLTGFQADVARLDFLTQALNELKEQGLGAGNIKFDAVQGEIDKIGFGPKFLKGAQDAVDKIGEYVTPVVNQLGSIFSQIFANRSAEIDAYYEKERANIEASAISEEAKANKIKALDEDVAKKKRALARKQAIADKAAALFGAAVEGARAIISAFGKGPIYGAIVSALVAAQVAAIAATPLPSLAIGTDYVRQDGLAMLHKGEAVVPADVVGGGFSRGGMVNVSGRIQGTDILLVSDYAMDFKTRIR